MVLDVFIGLDSFFQDRFIAQIGNSHAIETFKIQFIILGREDRLDMFGHRIAHAGPEVFGWRIDDDLRIDKTMNRCTL